MKKFTLKAIALATASICGSAAFAGSITSPAVGAATAYAVESMTATTDVTLPPVTYQMGVDRTANQDFTMIFTPSAGTAFTAGSCAAALTGFTAGGTGAAEIIVSLKRASTTECAYEVDIGGVADVVGSDTTTTLTFSGFVLDSHTLNVAGNTASVTVALKDLGETAFIDNAGSLTRVVATSGNALTLVAAADTATKADVNDEQGPLFGFVSVGDDGDAVARASFQINNNGGATTFMKPDGTTPWDFTSDGTSLAITVAGDFQGLLANGFLVGGDLGTPTATVAAGTATFSFLPAAFDGTGTYNVTTTFTSARTASLGTSRVFGVSGVNDVVTGANVALAGNASWWTWGANASQLVTPYFNTNVNYITRFFFLNTSNAAVSYSTQCFTEGGNAVTNGAGGSLAANATTNVLASSVCTFPAGTPRGGVIFTINAPIQKIKGTYQSILPDGTSSNTVPLTRPYTSEQTTE